MSAQLSVQELERLHAASFAWAMHCSRGGRDEAEDLLQEVYMRILEERARFDGRSNVKTWVFGVIRFTARERSRRRWLQLRLLERWYSTNRDPPPATDPTANPVEEEQHRPLRRALATLPPRQQEVLHLVFYQEMTVDDTARTLGISAGSARTHFARGKARLRELLTRDHFP